MPKVRFILLQLLLVFSWMIFSPTIVAFSSFAKEGTQARQKKELKADAEEEEDSKEEGKEEQEKESVKEWYCSSCMGERLAGTMFTSRASYYQYLNHILPNGYSGIHTPPPKC